MAVSPFSDRSDHGHKALALACELVFHLGRNDAVILTLNQPQRRQRLQFATENTRAISRDDDAAPRSRPLLISP